MKSSWILAIVMLYLVIFGAELMVTGGSSFSNSLTTNQSTLMSPDVSNIAGTSSNEVSFVKNLGYYFNLFVSFAGIFALWQPTVFSGLFLWFWWFICFPIDLMMVFAVVSMLRGVHSA